MEIRIIKISTQSRIISRLAKKKFESDLRWTDVSYDEAFQKIEENDEWIKSIYFTFFYENESNSGISYNQQDIICQIARNGMFKCNSKLTLFYNTVIKDIIYKAIADLELLKNRDRYKQDNLRAKPISIEYGVNLFKDKNQNMRLIDVLQKITYSSLSVIHSNPYLHCSFTDFRDGSSYDIWILSNNEITIIPQMKSTYASLERLCNHIFIGLREGIIKDFEG